MRLVDAIGAEKKAKREALETAMLQQLRALKLDAGLVQQHRFHPSRKWQFDFAWPDRYLALEVEGGIFVGGRHTRGAGMEADMEKYAQALLAGWQVLRVGSSHIKDGRALLWVERLMRRPA